MDTIKKKYEEMSKAYAAAQDIANNVKARDGKFEEGEHEQWEKHFKDYTRLKQEYDALKSQEEAELINAESVEESAKEVKMTPEQFQEGRLKALRKYLIVGENGLSQEERTVLGNYTQSEVRGTDTQITTTDSLGGYLVPQGFVDELNVARALIGGVRPVARILTTNSGNTLDWPTLDDTATSGAIQTTEGGTIPVSDLTFAQKQLGAFTYHGGIMKFSIQLLQDDGVNIQSFLGDIAGRRIEKKLNTDLTSGDGSTKATGFLTDCGIYGPTAGTTLAASDIYDHLYSVDPEYRSSGVWMMNDDVLAEIVKLTVGSSDDRPLWQASLQVGAPPTIAGKPYQINQAMATYAAGNNIMAFGDFKQYVVREVIGTRMFRFNERYMDGLNVAFLMWLRADGKLVGPTDSIKRMYLSAT